MEGPLAGSVAHHDHPPILAPRAHIHVVIAPPPPLPAAFATASAPSSSALGFRVKLVIIVLRLFLYKERREKRKRASCEIAEFVQAHLLARCVYDRILRSRELCPSKTERYVPGMIPKRNGRVGAICDAIKSWGASVQPKSGQPSARCLSYIYLVYQGRPQRCASEIPGIPFFPRQRYGLLSLANGDVKMVNILFSGVRDKEKMNLKLKFDQIIHCFSKYLTENVREFPI